MEYIAVEDLDIGDREIDTAVDDQVARIVFLAARFSVEAGSIKDDTKRCAFWDQFCGCCKGLIVVDGLHNGINVALA